MRASDKLTSINKVNNYLLLALLVLLCSCVKDDTPDPLPTERTVFVYLAGDNDLSVSVSAVVESIRSGWSHTGGNCLIYTDPADAPPRLLRVRGGCSAHPTPYIETVATYEEENSASAEVFARVVRHVVSHYPAPNYGLIFASHATGWMPSGTLANPRSVARTVGSDTDPGTVEGAPREMELADFAAAIPEGQFDFIIFEACLMAGVEVAYELRGKTDYILASSAELLVPGFVPIYGKSQHYLFDTKLTVEQALTGFATDYHAYINTQSGAHRSATLSIIKTSELAPLALLLKGVSLSGASLTETQHFDRPGSYGENIITPRYFDLLHAAEQTATPTQYEAISKKLNDIVVWKAATPSILWGYNGFEVKHHCGLTTYIEQPQLPELNSAYKQTAWYNAIH